MPTYETTSGRPMWINPAHVVYASPADDIGITQVVFSPTAVNIGPREQGSGAGLTGASLKCPFTNFKADMERWEKAIRRGGMEVIK